MTPQQMLEYCLGKFGAWEDQPWEDHLVARVGPADASYDFVVSKLPKKHRPN